MASNIKLNSSEWCDLVFEGRNKNYGAYNLRQTSTKRHIVAFVISISVVATLIAIPSLLETLKPNKADQTKYDTQVIISDITQPKIPEEKIIIPEPIQAKIPTQATIKYTPPIIIEDSKVKEEDELKPITEIDKGATIASTTTEGPITSTPATPSESNGNEIIGENVNKKPFTVVQQMPIFPGGDAELMRFIASNLRYPNIAIENGIQGRVVLRFVVNETGNVSDIEVLKTLDPSCDKEAVRVVKSMPKWIPGMQNGRNVPVYYTLPILFRLH